MIDIPFLILALALVVWAVYSAVSVYRRIGR